MSFPLPTDVDATFGEYRFRFAAGSEAFSDLSRIVGASADALALDVGAYRIVGPAGTRVTMHDGDVVQMNSRVGLELAYDGSTYATEDVLFFRKEVLSAIFRLVAEGELRIGATTLTAPVDTTVVVDEGVRINLTFPVTTTFVADGQTYDLPPVSFATFALDGTVIETGDAK